MPLFVWSLLPGFALALPLGIYLLPVYGGRPTLLTSLLRPVETALYRLARVDPAIPMPVRTYLRAAAAFGLMASLTSLVWPGPAAAVIRNVPCTAVAMALVMMALRRMQPQADAGNFWADLVRGHLYVLLPLSGLALLLLATSGVADALDAYARLHMHDTGTDLPRVGDEAAHLVMALETGRDASLPTLQWLALLSRTVVPLALGVALVMSFPSSGRAHLNGLTA